VQSALPVAGGLDDTGTVQTAGVVADVGSSFASDPSVYPALVPSTAQTALGGAFSVGIEGSASSVAVLFVSLRTGPTLAFPGVLGLGALNPLLFAQLGVTSLDAAGLAAFPLVVPPLPALFGATLVFQAVEASGAGLAVTNPAAVPVTQ
jgi:hypothetical protein